MNKLEQIRAIQESTELNYNITMLLIALTMLVLFVRAVYFILEVNDSSIKYRVRYESEEWQLQYKTSSNSVWGVFQTYIGMAEALQDKEYFESLNHAR